jgi:hypothetical protein
VEVQALVRVELFEQYHRLLNQQAKPGAIRFGGSQEGEPHRGSARAARMLSCWRNSVDRCSSDFPA